MGSGRRLASKIDIIGLPFSVAASTDESALNRVVVPWLIINFSGLPSFKIILALIHLRKLKELKIF